MNGTPRLDSDREQDMGGLASLPGLETVSEQLAGPIAVLRAEQARRQAGAAIRRPAWKNLVFTGGPGAGKTRAAKAVTRIYTELGLLSFGHLREITAADLTGTTLQETGTLVAETVRRASGDLLMINDAHAWFGLPDRGRHLLRCLYKELTDSGGQLAGDPGRAGRPAPRHAARQPGADRPLPGRHRLPRLHRRPGRRHLRHRGPRGRVHPDPRRRAEGRNRARPG